MRLTATIVLLPLLAIRAGTVVPEVDTSTGQVHPAVLESRITGAYAAATNRANLAKSYADDAIATATADMVVADELGNAITLEAALRVAGDIFAQSNAQAYAEGLMETGTAFRATSAGTVTGLQSNLIAGAVQATDATYTQTVALAGSAVQPGVLATARVDYATSSGTATNATYVLGDSAWITMSGTTGLLYRVDTNGIGYVVTGTLDPDWTGVYRESGDYDPPRYYSADGSTMLWWLEDASRWAIVDSVPFSGDLGWSAAVAGATNAPTEGTYYPHIYARGDASVTRVVNLVQTNAYAIATTADLETALAAYSPTGHGHAIADVTGLQSSLDTIPDEAEIESIAESAAESVAQTAPEWIALTNLSAAITVTNQYERPISLYSTGTVTVAFSGLRPPQALYCVIRGPDALTFPGAHLVGGGSWQTNQANHFLVWSLGTNLMVHPVTTTPLED